MRAAAAAALAACLAVARAQPKNTYDGKYKPGWNGEAKTPPVCSPPHPSTGQLLPLPPSPLLPAPAPGGMR